MSEDTKPMTAKELAVGRERRLAAMHLQDLENNPLSSDQLAMFEMFEREGWSHKRRIAYISGRARHASMTSAAE